jgi:hypothetical protein
VNNRVTPYAGGWLTFLIRQGICTEAEAREAQSRVAQAAIDELEARRAASREKKKRKRQEDE